MQTSPASQWISECCYRYERKLSDENAEIADWLEKLADNRRTWGFGLCFLYLRNVKGFGWNCYPAGHVYMPKRGKRVYRIYCELELNLRIRPKKRLKRDKSDALAVPDAPNHTWSMDFMADQLADGRPILTLNVLGRCRAGYCAAMHRSGLQPRRLGHRGGLLAARRAGHPQPEPDHRMARETVDYSS